MSLWRKEASGRLPELQKIIASKEVTSPMSLWIELRLSFQKLCGQKPAPLELLRRIWGYATWCLDQGSGDVGTAAALAFCEHLIDTDESRQLLPLIMSRQDFEGCRELILYHHTKDEYESVLKLFRKGNRELGRDKKMAL